MQETKREKRTRFFLIVLFISLTAFAIFNKYKEDLIHKPYKGPIAFVYHESSSPLEPPLIVLYEYRNKEHLLVLYEIERNNRYKFNALKTKVLQKAPSSFACDNSNEGFWVKQNNKWEYFDSNLDSKVRSSKYVCKNLSKEIPYTMEKTGNRTIIKIDSKEKVSLAKTELPTGVHALSENRTVWLITLKNGVKIVTTDTK